MSEQPVENTTAMADEEPFNYSLLKYARIMRIEGTTDEQLRILFAEKGHSQDMAERVLEELNKPVQEEPEVAYGHDANDDIRTGTIWLLGGISVTIGRYAYGQTNGGGGYILTYGAIIYGAFKLLSGIHKRG